MCTHLRQSQQSGKEVNVTSPEATVLLASQTNKSQLSVGAPRVSLVPRKNKRSLRLSHSLRKQSVTRSAAFMKPRNLCHQMPLASFVFYPSTLSLEPSLSSFWNQMGINKQISRQIGRQMKTIQCWCLVWKETLWALTEGENIAV